MRSCRATGIGPRDRTPFYGTSAKDRTSNAISGITASLHQEWFKAVVRREAR